MFYSVLFIIGLALFTGLYLYWGFTRLTEEKRQVLAAVPRMRMNDSVFAGVNITWYGLLTANALAVGAVIFLVLSGSLGTPALAGLLLVTLLLCVLLPSARWIARIVEKKQHTFTIGGSVFAGIIITPWVIGGANLVTGPLLGFRFPLTGTLAAMAIAYSLGESLGRLACISFGCCYGKPLSDCSPVLRRLFARRHFIFRGATRKACYASGLDGVPVLPIQAVTAVIYAVSALLGLILFLMGHVSWALFLTLSITQTWRTASEVFRADYRGGGRMSAYQIMGLTAAAYAALTALIFRPEGTVMPNLIQGMSTLWDPFVILTVQGLWLMVFAYMGRSTVTDATLHFRVVTDHI
ncbi:hypothetical protein JCM14469_07260 [Desulfatiferula olefinivorans]